MRILITGGSGFIGTNLVDHYMTQGHNVLNVDFNPPRNTLHSAYWFNCDIRDYEPLRRIVLDFKPNFVLHMAATTGLDGKSLADYSTNTIGVENILKLAEEIPGIEKTVFASTMLVCKAGYYPKHDEDYCATTLYGESKMNGEMAVRKTGRYRRWTIIRPTSIWGPWFGRTYRDFFISIYRGRYFNFSGGMCTKTYGYIGNVVYQINTILFNETADGMTLYVGDYTPTQVDAWAIEIASELGREIYTLPRTVIKLAAYTGDMLNLTGIRFPMNSFRFSNMTTNNILDLTSTKLIAPETKFTRKEGNKHTIKWMLDNGYLKY